MWRMVTSGVSIVAASAGGVAAALITGRPSLGLWVAFAVLVVVGAAPDAFLTLTWSGKRRPPWVLAAFAAGFSVVAAAVGGVVAALITGRPMMGLWVALAVLVVAGWAPLGDLRLLDRLPLPGVVGARTLEQLPGRSPGGRPPRTSRRLYRHPVQASPPPPSASASASASQAVGYDDLVQSANADLVKQGHLLFNPPGRMKLSQTELVEVRVTRTLKLDAELLEYLRGHGNPPLAEIPTAPLMAVTLSGDGFRIKAYSDEEQSVTQDVSTKWQFDICALKRGQQRLVMSVSLRIPLAGQPLVHKSLAVREFTIDVQVGAPALVGHFVSSSWQWLITTAIGIAAVVAAVRYH